MSESSTTPKADSGWPHNSVEPDIVQGIAAMVASLSQNPASKSATEAEGKQGALDGEISTSGRQSRSGVGDDKGRAVGRKNKQTRESSGTARRADEVIAAIEQSLSNSIGAIASGSESASPRLPKAVAVDFAIPPAPHPETRKIQRSNPEQDKRKEAAVRASFAEDKTRPRASRRHRNVCISSVARAFTTVLISLLVWLCIIGAGLYALEFEEELVSLFVSFSISEEQVDALDLLTLAVLSFLVVLTIVGFIFRGDSAESLEKALGPGAAPLKLASEPVRAEIENLAEKLETVIMRASDLEVVVRREIGALEDAYAENESRHARLLSELETQRNSIVQHVIRVKTEAKALEETLQGNAHAAITLLKATHDDLVGGLSLATISARDSLKGVGVEISGITKSALSDLADQSAEQIRVIEAKLRDAGRQARDEMSEVEINFRSTLKKQRLILAADIKKHAEVSSGNLEAATRILSETMKGSADTGRRNLDAAAAALESTLGQKLQEIEGVMQRATAQLDESFASRVEELAGLIQTQAELVSEMSRAAATVASRPEEVVDLAGHTSAALRREEEQIRQASGTEKQRVLKSTDNVTRRLDAVIGRMETAGRYDDGLEQIVHAERSWRELREIPKERISNDRSSGVVSFPRKKAIHPKGQPSLGGGIDHFRFVRSARVRQFLGEMKRDVDQVFPIKAARMFWLEGADVESFEKKFLTASGRIRFLALKRGLIENTTSSDLYLCCEIFCREAAKRRSDESLMEYLTSAEGRVFTIVAAATGELAGMIDELLS